EVYLSERGIWLRISVDPILDDKGNLTGSVHIIRDITESKEAEEKLQIYQEHLRALASKLLLAEESERKRIATDIHDNIGQILTFSKIKLGALKELATSPSLVRVINEIRELTDQAIKYTRSLTFELSPPILYELGFEAAIEWLGEQIIKSRVCSSPFRMMDNPSSWTMKRVFFYFRPSVSCCSIVPSIHRQIL
ncbi:MAG: PAS domain S-box protein, partial [Nitrospira sp.]|nr:PAS domain S-box protein [Nitrospira sp.]